jgi:hypothetical protein
MKFSWFVTLRCRAIAVVLTSAPLFVACEKPNIPVNVHGVNYGDGAFTYVVADPITPANSAGGELIDSYSAGGTMCCYDLPRKWRPGIKLSIDVTHHVGKLADHTLHDVPGTEQIEIPRYPDDKPGEIWVLRTADGKLDAVLSDFQPDHPKWPGKVKGWPIPSLEFQRRWWDISIQHNKEGIEAFEKSLAELKSDPDTRSASAWEYALRSDRKSIVGFSGPKDPNYRDMLRSEDLEGLKLSYEELERLQRGRP